MEAGWELVLRSNAADEVDAVGWFVDFCSFFWYSIGDCNADI